jgi:hypothetical protein
LSSILKALKKVEGTPPPKDGENELRKKLWGSGASSKPRRDMRPILLSAGVAGVLVAVFFVSRVIPPQETPGDATGSVPVPGPELASAPPSPAWTIADRPASPAAARPSPAGTERPKDFGPGNPEPRGTAVGIPDLRLEGIMWSDAPENRFAVINGEIVRQGGTVQDIRVTRIAEDHVLVQSRDGAWKKRLSVR